jgi:hypothetical protein
MEQQHGRQRDQGRQREAEANPTQGGLAIRCWLRLDYGRLFHQGFSELDVHGLARRWQRLEVEVNDDGDFLTNQVLRYSP